MDGNEIKLKKKSDIKKIISAIRSFENKKSANYIQEAFNEEKINSSIKSENESLVISSENKIIDGLFDEFILEVGKIVDFIDGNIDYIVNECGCANKKIIGRFETEDLVHNYFKLIAIIMELNTNAMGRGEKHEFENFLFYFNSSVLLSGLKKYSYRNYDYYYYRFIYINEVISFKLNDISDEVKSYNDINGELYSKVKNKFLKIEIETQEGINRLDTNLKSKMEELNALEKRINKNNDLAIFVSLDKGYKSFFRSKSIELKSAFRWTLGLGVLVLLPTIIKAFGVIGWISIPPYNIYGYVGSATITFILLYYFRVSYLNYNSIKTELTQISLRRNLCAFINGYSDFAQRNKNSPESLKQFENIIFSNIISDSKNIPATYDGIEQLAKLIVSLKAPNKAE